MIFRVKSDFTEFSDRTDIRGDFADILWNGEVEYDIDKKTISVERFGEYIPPIYVKSYEILISIEEIKEKLCISDLTGFECISVQKKKIIAGDWLNFDEDFFIPYYSMSDVIKKQKNDSELARKVPNLFWIKPIYPLNFVKTNSKIECFAENQADFYWGKGAWGGLFVSQKAKNLFESLSLPLIFIEQDIQVNQ